jgi:UV DNA damage endonuclease
MRLGFAVRVLGRPGLRAYDSRRPANYPHLSVSLAHLRDVFAYLAMIDVHFYRMSSDLAPYLTHPELPQLHNQIDECATELAAIGQIARQQALRLTFHAPMHVQLGSLDAEVVKRSIETLSSLAMILERMELDANAVIVVHVGSLHGDADATIDRWIRCFEHLPPTVQRRLVLEHEDDGPSLPLALRIHGATGIPVVFDYLHFCLNNPEQWSLTEALAAALASWPYTQTPKIHFSSPRTELQAVERVDELRGRRRWVLKPPRPGHHADLVNPWEFAVVVRTAQELRDFDVMLEAKAGDVALLRLRQDIQNYVPTVAQWLCESRSVI